MLSQIKRTRKSTKVLNGIYKSQWEELKEGYYMLMPQNEREDLKLYISYDEEFRNKIKIIMNRRISGFRDVRRFILMCYKLFTEKF